MAGFFAFFPLVVCLVGVGTSHDINSRCSSDYLGGRWHHWRGRGREFIFIFHLHLHSIALLPRQPGLGLGRMYEMSS